MYPIKLKPAFKDYLWGGTRLRDDFGKDCDFDKIAESWELSCHKDSHWLSILKRKASPYSEQTARSSRTSLFL